MRFILIVMLIMFASVVTAGNCCEDYDKDCCVKLTEKWQDYRDARTVAKTNDSVEDYVKAALIAIELEREDIASWQYNNAGYSLIKKYAAQSKEEKDNGLLEEAKDLLIKAQQLDDGTVIKRKEAISSNFGYIDEHLK